MAVKKSDPRIIRAEADIAEGMKYLGRRCAHMRRAQDLIGMPPLRRRRGGFEGLSRIIVAQQLSVASAGSITKRMMKLVRPFNVENIDKCPDEMLRSCGLSRPKIRTLRALAGAVGEGTVNFRPLSRGSPTEVAEVLTSVKGIGPWTADIYVMFCLGHSDGFAAGDLALQQAAGELFGLEARPTADELLELSQRWRPWRGVAARVLWSYYAHNRAQKSALPA